VEPLEVVNDGDGLDGQRLNGQGCFGRKGLSSEGLH
jgi:hypothetical protein